MSTVTASDTVASAPPKGKKKLFIMLGAALLVLALAGGGAVVYLKKKAAAEAEAAEAEADAEHAPKKAAKKEGGPAPTFVPLDPFTVNLADREAERYAQVAVALELEDPKVADQIKVYMPAIRNNILMVLSHKTAGQLLEREGKSQLAQEIRRETARALGTEIEDEAPPPKEAKKADAAEDDEDAPKKKKKKKAPQVLPIVAVHFSNFIIQ